MPKLTAQFYDLFMVKRSPSTGTPLNCREHPFFDDIHEIPKEQKAFYDRIFAKEEDILEGSLFDWAPVKKLIIEQMYEGVKKMEIPTF